MKSLKLYCVIGDISIYTDEYQAAVAERARPSRLRQFCLRGPLRKNDTFGATCINKSSRPRNLNAVVLAQ